MRRLGAILLAVALLAQVNTAAAQTPTTPAKPAAAEHDWKPVVVGLGAIAGVVVFNVAAIGLEALPGGLAYGAAGATLPAEASVAISRVYATTSAVIGGLIGYYAYGSSK